MCWHSGARSTTDGLGPCSYRVSISRKSQANFVSNSNSWVPIRAPMQEHKTETHAETDSAAMGLTWEPVAIERDILAVLDAPKQEHETFESAFRRKEHELGVVLSRLTPADSLRLERRLVLSLGDDPIAVRFSRLVVARRDRLVRLITGARRRHPSLLTRAGGRHE